jgi:hypothetical protein
MPAADRLSLRLAFCYNPPWGATGARAGAGTAAAAAEAACAVGQGAGRGVPLTVHDWQ